MKDLIFVAGHAPFKESTAAVPEDPTRDDAWVLQSFQRGESALYIQHIRRGVELASVNGDALLIFSGGFTRVEAGRHWSEAATYMALANHYHWWGCDSVAARAAEEDHSRDSFENLLFSICRFQQITGAYPRHVTAVSWAFKEHRFHAHAQAIRIPAERFRFEGCGQPVDLASALKSEAATQEAFARDPYGSSGVLRQKRETRNPFHREHPFRSCPGLAAFFDILNNPASSSTSYPARLPWE